MSKTVVIRADGGKYIGMGHLSRSVLIANYLQSKFSVKSILILKKNEQALQFLQNKSIQIKLIPENIELNEEVELTKEIIQNVKCGLFILDVLENDVNDEYTSEIRNSNVPFAAITDDSFKRVINAHVIINGNPCQNEDNYINEQGKYFLGSKFFIMDEKYSNFIPKSPKGGLKNILLTVGGSDHNDLIFNILKALERVGGNLNITLITSKGTGYVEKLNKYIESSSITIKLLVDIPGIISEWENCDFAITAGGNTLFERIAARKPGLTICQLQRQMEIADKFEELGVNYNLGFGPELTVDDIYFKLKQYLSQTDKHLTQYNLSPKYIDGDGLHRVSTIFKNLIV